MSPNARATDGGEPTEMAAIVSALTPTVPHPATGSATAAGTRSEGVLGSGAVAWAAQLAGAVAEGIQAKRPDQAVPVDDIATQSEILALRILFTLADVDDPGGETELADRTIESIRQLIARSVPFDRIAETIRYAHELVIRGLLTVAIAREASAATLTTITLTVTTLVNDLLDTMANQYLTERQRFSSSGVRAQQEMVDLLIAGLPVDSHSAGHVLKSSIEDYHMGMVISGSASSPRDVNSLRQSADIARSRLHASAFVVRENPDSIWLWASSPSTIRIDEAELAAAIGDAFRVGVGSSQPGAEGFRRTHLEAIAANHFGRFGSASVVDYGLNALPILLSADEEKARWFVDSELGELAVPSPRNRDLLLTLRCYFNSRLRIAVAAERLHVHRNTAISRLSTIEEMLGHAVTVRMAQVQAALSILEFVEARDPSRSAR